MTDLTKERLEELRKLPLSELLDHMGKQATCIFIAADEVVAADISASLTLARDLIKRQQEALEPFGKMGAQLSDKYPDEDTFGPSLDFHSLRVRITLGDLRRARSAWEG